MIVIWNSAIKALALERVKMGGLSRAQDEKRKMAEPGMGSATVATSVLSRGSFIKVSVVVDKPVDTGLDHCLSKIVYTTTA